MNGKIRFTSFVKPYRFLIFIALVCVLASNLATLSLPWILKIFIDTIVPAKDMQLLYGCLFALFIVYCIRAIFRYIFNYLLNYSSERILFDIRTKVFKHLQSLSMRFYENNRTGKIISNLVTDCALLQQAVPIIATLISSFCLFVGASMLLFFVDIHLAVIFFLFIPFHIVNVLYFSGKKRAKMLSIRALMADITANISEVISGTKVIKGFALEKKENIKFAKSLRPVIAKTVEHNQLTVFYAIIFDFLDVVCRILIFIFAAWRLFDGKISIGGFVAFYSYLTLAINPVLLIANNILALSSSLAGMKRIESLFDEKPDIENSEISENCARFEGNISFENVSFSYEGKHKNIDGFSLEIKAGEKVALVGASGSGKSTISNLLLRFYDVDDGSICVDGHDIRGLKIEDYRKQLGMVLQDNFLFSGSVKENISYPDAMASDEEIIRVAKMANVDEFVQDMPQKYNTTVGENGVALSGGQKQRIAIARAILRKPRILVLDEATSALDNVSEKIVQKALDHLMEGRTAIIIAHRLSTIRNADRIVVMENGKIIEIGTHEQLLAMKGKYFQMHQEQNEDDAS